MSLPVQAVLNGQMSVKLFTSVLVGNKSTIVKLWSIYRKLVVSGSLIKIHFSP